MHLIRSSALLEAQYIFPFSCLSYVILFCKGWLPKRLHRIAIGVDTGTGWPLILCPWHLNIRMIPSAGGEGDKFLATYCYHVSRDLSILDWNSSKPTGISESTELDGAAVLAAKVFITIQYLRPTSRQYQVLIPCIENQPQKSNMIWSIHHTCLANPSQLLGQLFLVF